ncbi:hypothetical protein [Ensifer canadensis]
MLADRVTALAAMFVHAAIFPGRGMFSLSLSTGSVATHFLQFRKI